MLYDLKLLFTDAESKTIEYINLKAITIQIWHIENQNRSKHL